MRSLNYTSMLCDKVVGKEHCKIELEITERSYIENFVEVSKNIEKLKKYGIEIAIDDFGTGYSSLHLLHSLKADSIKIDKSLLDNIVNEKGKILYSQLCLTLKKLGYKLIAEGVETEEQVDFLLDSGVDIVQGWVYAPALSFEEAKQFALSLG